MLPATTLQSIMDRLQRIPYAEWGPDGVRYVSILFWDNLGYRLLRNQFLADDWARWSYSSGDFWDLFLAGCHQYGPADIYGPGSQVLADHRDGRHSIPFLWNQSKTHELLQQVMSLSKRVANVSPWSFEGPIEIFAVGARRIHGNVELDWRGARGMKLPINDLSAAVGYYTQAHIDNDATLIPDHLPSPGDFSDTLPRELLVDIGKQLPWIGRLFK